DPPPAVSAVVLGARRLLRAADAEKVFDRLTVALREEDGAGRAGSLRSLLRRHGENGARGGPWRKTLRASGKSGDDEEQGERGCDSSRKRHVGLRFAADSTPGRSPFGAAELWPVEGEAEGLRE